MNNNIEGCRLLLLNANDLKNLNITKAGHQEIVLEAVEQLKQLHYNFASETLQSMALRLSCRSRSLHNQLKVQSISNAKRAAVDAAKAAAALNDDHKHHHHKEHKLSKKEKKDREKRSSESAAAGQNAHQQSSASSQNEIFTSGFPDSNGTATPPKDNTPVSTATLHSVTEILSSVKEFMSWLDRYPFDGNEKYAETRKTVLRCAIELASTAQRDQFVQYPNDVIRERCLEVAEQCDKLIQKLSDSLAMQCATLEVVTVTKSVKEELGMNIVSSYSGIHQVGWLKYDSPAAKNGNIEEGDEIVQVNYQTVVGWQLKKLVASMRQFPMKIILTVKKRPRHFSGANFTLISPFSLPIPDMAILSSSGPAGGGDDNYGGRSAQHQAVLKNSEKFYGIPAPVVPVPDGALLSFPCSPNPNSNSVASNSANCEHQQANNNEQYSLYSTGPQNPIPVVTTYASYKSTGPGQPALINNHGKMTQPYHIAPTSMMPQTLSQYAVAKASVASKVSPAVQLAAEKALASLNTAGTNQEKTALKSVSSPCESPSKGSGGLATAVKRQPHVHRSKNGSERKSRVATTRCSSASDSSPFSMSDSTSTMYSSSDDEVQVLGKSSKCTKISSPSTSIEKCSSVNVRHGEGAFFAHNTATTTEQVGNNFASNKEQQGNVLGAHLDSKNAHKRTSVEKSAKTSAFNTQSGNAECTTDSDAGFSGNDDNDSAFYSGRTTSNNDINGAASSSGHSSGGSASGRCSAGNQAIQHNIFQPKVHSLAHEESLMTSNNNASSSPSPSIEAFALVSEKNGRHGRAAPVQPRTSAEFEALYLQKTASSSSQEFSMPTPTVSTSGAGLSSKVARASTLPPNAQPCSMMDEPEDRGPEQVQRSAYPPKAKLEKCNSSGGGLGGFKSKQSSAISTNRKLNMSTNLNEVQQKVVNSLTNLVQNIRVANTVSVNSVAASSITPNPGVSHLGPVHQQKDERLEALGKY